MTTFRQIPIEQVKAALAESRLKEKPTSEQLRGEAETLRQAAIKLMERAAVLIEKSARLEHQVSLLKRGNPKQGKKS
jgi:hypothetical protein